MDVWSHEGRYNQKRTRERISKSSTSDKEDHRDMAKVVRTCQGNGRRLVIYLLCHIYPGVTPSVCSSVLPGAPGTY